MEAFVSMRDGARLWTVTAGKGPPIVLLNGGPGMPDYLAPVSAMLEGSARVHRYEPRGCGRSGKAARYTLEQAMTDLEDLRAHWGYARWLVVGHSWGADLALAYALTHRDAVTAIVGIAGGRIHDDRAWSETYQQNKHREPEPVEGPPNLAVNAMLMDQWRTFCRAPDLLARIARLQTPALYVTGAEDIRPTWGTAQIARLLPNGAHVEIPGADHYPWRDRAGDLASVLRSFLADHSGPK
jgi:proline iminopeptidase